MAKVTIVIEDVADKTVMIDIKSDPPLGTSEKLSPAQELTHYLNECIKEVLEDKFEVPKKESTN